MPIYNITLTDTYNKALTYVAEDQFDWINNAVQERCRIAVEEIVKIALDKCLEEGIQLPITKEEIVDLAFEKKWVKTVVEVNQKFIDSMPKP